MEIKRRVKNDPKSFNLDLTETKGKAADRAGLGGKELKFGFDCDICEMSSKYGCQEGSDM